jgi:glycosyltransferase involved in cell wall biosynthesis
MRKNLGAKGKRKNLRTFMKVLMCNKFLFEDGGPERYILELSDMLEKHGNQVVYFAMQHPKNIKTEYSKYFVSQVFLSNHRKVNWKEKMKTSLKIIYSIEAQKKIERLISEQKPDLAHLHNIYHQISPSILPILQKKGIPVVMSLHDYKLVCPNYSLMTQGEVCEKCNSSKYYQAVLHKCVKDSFSASLLNCMEMYVHKFLKLYEKNVDLFIAPSLFMQEKLSEFGLDKSKIFYLPPWVKEIESSPSYNYSYFFLYFGKISKEKGVETLIRAMEKIKKGQLLIAGEGEEKDRLQNYTNQNRIDNVKFLGFMERSQLNELIRACRFVVLPSEWYENSPSALYESFALGKPVIGSRIGGIPELIQDGVNGLLFEPKNTEELKEKITYLYHRPLLAQKMGMAARKFVEEKYSAEEYYNKLLSVYQNLIQKRGLKTTSL